MIIKVCGLKDSDNINQVAKLNVDWIGYNFYDQSLRFINKKPVLSSDFKQLKVGVFVNAELLYIKDKIDQFKLDIVQLHGDESPEFCSEVQKLTLIIKVFRINNYFNINLLDAFSFADYFLFDKDSKSYGGSGLKFDWSILSNIEISRPFLLSGGIGFEDAERILSFKHDKFIGIDINSKFEIEPGLKDSALISSFIGKIC